MNLDDDWVAMNPSGETGLSEAWKTNSDIYIFIYGTDYRGAVGAFHDHPTCLDTLSSRRGRSLVLSLSTEHTYTLWRGSSHIVEREHTYCGEGAHIIVVTEHAYCAKGVGELVSKDVAGSSLRVMGWGQHLTSTKYCCCILNVGRASMFCIDLASLCQLSSLRSRVAQHFLNSDRGTEQGVGETARPSTLVVRSCLVEVLAVQRSRAPGRSGGRLRGPLCSSGPVEH
jgi:hypothetical protein